MVRPPSIDSNGMKKGAWSEDEDNKLRAYILRYGHWNWRLLPKYAGLKRCGKSCRLRWVNYLKPGVKRGNFTKEEQELVIKLHAELGNRWSAIAEKLPGRTDNEIKNFWHTRVERRRKTNPAVKNTAKANPICKASPDSSSEASSLSTSQPPSNPSLSTNSQDQLELEFMLSEILAADTNYAQNEECFAPLLEEEFDYPELRYSDLSSCSGSSYANKWTVDDDVCGSFWKNESSASNITSNSESEISSYTPLEEEGLQFYDPLLQYFDYEMNQF